MVNIVCDKIHPVPDASQPRQKRNNASVRSANKAGGVRFPSTIHRRRPLVVKAASGAIHALGVPAARTADGRRWISGLNHLEVKAISRHQFKPVCLSIFALPGDLVQPNSVVDLIATHENVVTNSKCLRRQGHGPGKTPFRSPTASSRAARGVRGLRGLCRLNTDDLCLAPVRSGRNTGRRGS